MKKRSGSREVKMEARSKKMHCKTHWPKAPSPALPTLIH